MLDIRGFLAAGPFLITGLRVRMTVPNFPWKSRERLLYITIHSRNFLCSSFPCISLVSLLITGVWVFPERIQILETPRRKANKITQPVKFRQIANSIFDRHIWIARCSMSHSNRCNGLWFLGEFDAEDFRIREIMGRLWQGRKHLARFRSD